MKVETSNQDFIMSHGKAPRGWGSWAFRGTVVDRHGSHSDLGVRFVTGNLVAARNEAKQLFKSEAASIGAAQVLLVETLS